MFCGTFFPGLFSAIVYFSTLISKSRSATEKNERRKKNILLWSEVDVEARKAKNSLQDKCARDENQFNIWKRQSALFTYLYNESNMGETFPATPTHVPS